MAPDHLPLSFPKVDVVLLSLNRCADTVAAIESAQAQAGVEAEIWIVDQGSDAACLQLLRDLASRGQIHLRELDRNVGVGAGRNVGMGLGRSASIVCLDNDAVFEGTHALALAAEALARQPQLGALAFRVKRFDTRLDDPGRWAYPPAYANRRGERFLTTRFVGCGHALRREALQKTRGYDEALFFTWEELDLSYQLIDAGYEILYEPAICVLHKLSGEGRIAWSKTRFYYQTRNRLYVDYKYLRDARRLVAFAAGYTIMGIFNGVGPAALRGIRDAVRMIRGLPAGASAIGPAGLEYVERLDHALRGSLINRLRTEVFRRLPAS